MTSQPPPSASNQAHLPSAPAAVAAPCADMDRSSPAATDNKSSLSGNHKGKDKPQHKQKNQPTQSKKAGKKAGGGRRDIQGPGQGSELYKRMNFLMQAAHLMAHQAGPIAPQPPCDAQAGKSKAPLSSSAARRRPKRMNKKRNRTTPSVTQSLPLAAVARHLAREMMQTARKNALKIDPTVKHFMCRRCSTVLIPGVSCLVSVIEPYDDANSTELTHSQPPTTPALDAMEVGTPTTTGRTALPPPRIQHTCTTCGFKRGHPVRPGYVPFHERAAVVEPADASS